MERMVSMNDAGFLIPNPIRLRRFIWALIGCWTLAIGLVLVWELQDERYQAEQLALSEALGAWKKDVAVRRWDAANGGVYIPVTEQTQPDPNLSHVSERDVTTSSGIKLTLIGAAAIMRSIDALTSEEFGSRSHITSLRPIRPQNAPDPWEKKALEAFETGKKQVSSIEDLGGEPCMRLMRPLMMEKSCLKCHAEQGYQVGDIRGGVSVSVPMSTVWPAERTEISHRIIGYGGMWIVGLLGIVMLSRQLRHQVERRYQTELKLRESHDSLEIRVAERTAELAESARLLQNEVAERKQAEQWLLQSEQRFRGYFEQGLIGMAILSPEKEWVEVNERLCKLLSYAEDELLLKSWSELTHAEDRSAEESHFQMMMGGNARGFVAPKRFLRKDGNYLSATVSAQCMRKEDGTVDCILVVMMEADDPRPAQGSPR
jgi:PAS domain S-box-containing protein